jgi:pilus assembly protein CpaC
MVQRNGVYLISSISLNKLFLVVLILSSCFLILQTGICKAKKNITLTVGQSKVLKFDFPIQKAATGAAEVCVINRTDLSEILINAKGVGETNILLWDDKQQLREEIVVTVVANDSARLAKELDSIFENTEGIKTKIVGNSVVVEGEVFSRKDLDRVNSLLAGMDGTINLVKMSPLLEKILTAEIQKAIGNRNVYVVKAKDSFLLEGTVSNETEKERAGKIATAYAPDIVNVIKVNVLEKNEKIQVDSRMVQMTMNIMQIENEVLKDLGFHWNPGASSAAVGSAGISSGESTSSGTITGTITNLFPKMRRLNEAGKARSLFQQSVVTKTGDKAHFFVGDEIPIMVAQQGGPMSVEYKKIGLTLNFSPVIGQSGIIQTFVEVESSSVNGEGQGGAPKVRQTKLQSAISVKSSESMALGGLIGQREARAFTTPSSGNADAIVQVNDSTRFQHDKSQILIFVTPEILSAGIDAVTEMGGKVKNSFKEYELDNIEKSKGK